MKRVIIILALMLSGLIVRSQTDFQYYNIALVKYNMSDYEGAITDLTRALDNNPENFSAWVLRGSARYNLENYAGAIDDYTRAIEIIKGEEKKEVKLTIYDQKGNIISSSGTVTPDPNLAVPFFNRALARLASGSYHEAVGDFTRALENESDKVSTYYNRGVALDSLGEHRRAFDDYTRVLEIEPGLAQVYYRRGFTGFGLGMPENACSDWSMALELGFEEASVPLNELCSNEDNGSL